MTYELRLPPSLRNATVLATPPPAQNNPVVSQDKEESTEVTPVTMPTIPVPEHEIITTMTRAEEVCTSIAPFEKVGMDVETFPASDAPGKNDALDHGKNRIRLVQVSTPDGKVAIFDLVALGGLPPGLTNLLQNDAVKKVVFNAHFDAGALHRHYGAEIKNVVDLYAGVLLVAGYEGYRTKGAHTLEREVGRYLGVALPKEAATSNWGAPTLSAEQIQYAARDAAVLLPLFDKVATEADRLGVTRAWQLDNDDIMPMVKAETAGITIDKVVLDTLITSAEADADSAGQRAREELGRVDLNLQSPKQILAAVKAKYGLVLEGTAEDVLEDYAITAPAVTDILAYRRGKGRSVTLQGYRDAIQPDGRIHARFNILAAPTGRMGCNAPNLLAVPRDPAVRSIFIPRPGYVFVVADYNASQMRIVAHITQDPELLKCFGGVPPICPHTRTAAKLFNKPIENVTPDQRKYAKPVNFGLIFGMSARGLVAYAKSTYGIHLSLEEAESFRKAFFDLYVGVRDWHWRTSQTAWAESSSRTASGRLRVLEQRNGGYSLTEHLNTPVQGMEADGMKRAISIVSERLAPLGGLILNVIHDEVLAEVPAGVAEEAKVIVVSGMESGMAEFVTSVPVKVDVGIFTSWAKP